jgi:hypothetical protein
LKYLLDQRLSTIPQHQWVSKLFGYDFSVEYRPGRQNVVADALSRRHSQEEAVLALSIPQFQIFADIRQEVATRADLKELHGKIAAGAAGD